MPNLRHLLIATAIVLVAPAHAFDLDIKGKTLNDALKIVSDLSGTKLQASAEVANEVIFLQAKGVSVETITQKLADATGCQWARNGDVFTLTLTNQAKVALQQESTKAETPAVLKGLEPYAQWLDKSNLDDPIEIFKSLAAKTPNTGSALNSVINKLLDDARTRALIDPSAAPLLAGLDLNTRSVFSSSPNLKQQKLPPSVQDPVWKALQKCQTVINQAVRDYPDRTDVAALARQWSENAVSQINLVVDRREDVVSVSLQLLNKNHQVGKTVGTLQIRVDNMAPSAQVPAWPKVAQPQDAMTQDFALAFATQSPRARSIDNTLVNFLTKPPTTFPVAIPFSALADPQSRPGLLDPATYEPLAYLAAPYMEKLAHKDNFLAILPDDLAGLMAAGLVTGDSAKFMAKEPLTTQINDGDWTVIRPVDRLHSIQSRANRQALSTLLASMSQHYGLASIDDLCVYASHSPKGLKNGGLDDSLVTWIFDRELDRPGTAVHGLQWYAYNLFSKVAKNLPASRMSDQPLLGPALEGYILNNPNSGGSIRIMNAPAVRSSPARPGQFSSIQIQGQLIVEGRSGDFTFQRNPQTEITDTLVRGISPAARISAVTSGGADLMLAFDLQSGRKKFYDAGSYADLLVAANYGGKSSYPASADAFGSYMFVKRETRVLTIELAPGMSTSVAVSGEVPAGKPGSYSSLSGPFVENVNKMMPAIEQNYQRRLNQPGNGGANTGGRRRGGGVIDPTP